MKTAITKRSSAFYKRAAARAEARGIDADVEFIAAARWGHAEALHAPTFGEASELARLLMELHRGRDVWDCCDVVTRRLYLEMARRHLAGFLDGRCVGE